MIRMSRIKIPPIKVQKIFIFQIFFNLTYQLQTQFSQLPNGQKAKFLGLSDLEFPEFLKTGIIFYPSPFYLGVMVKKTCPHFFWDTLYNVNTLSLIWKTFFQVQLCYSQQHHNNQAIQCNCRYLLWLLFILQVVCSL